MSPMRRRTGSADDSGPLLVRRARRTERDEGPTIRERLARAAAAIGAESRLTPEQARAVLEDRARALAHVPDGPPDPAQALEVLTLRTIEVLAVPAAATSPGQQALRGVTEDGLIVLDGAVLLQDGRLVVDQGEGAGV